MMKPKFEWDAKKAQSNLKKHGIAFEEGVTVFLDPLSISDPDHSEQEQRYIDIGTSDRGCVLVSFIPNEAETSASSAAARQQVQNDNSMMTADMKKTGKEMRSEYDFTGGVRGKHHKMMQEGYSVSVHKENGEVETQDFMPRKDDIIILEPDLRLYFLDSESVNRALRCLVPLLPKRV